MKYRLIYLIESRTETYNLLTEEEFNSKDDDFWEIWNLVAFEVDRKTLEAACINRGIPTHGMVITDRSSGNEFDNYIYIVGKQDG